jgi:hypothetical protein
MNKEECPNSNKDLQGAHAYNLDGICINCGKIMNNINIFNKILIHKIIPEKTSYPKPYFLPEDISKNAIEHFIEYVPKAVADDVLKENMILQKRLNKLENNLDIAEEEYLRQYSNGCDDSANDILGRRSDRTIKKSFKPGKVSRAKAKEAVKDIKAIHEKYKDKTIKKMRIK